MKAISDTWTIVIMCLGMMGIYALGWYFGYSEMYHERRSFAAVTTQFQDATNGTTILLFPEWSNSPSVLERTQHTNLYAVRQSDGWHTQFRATNGVLKAFWVGDSPSATISDAKTAFGMNISWQINKAMVDAFSK